MKRALLISSFFVFLFSIVSIAQEMDPAAVELYNSGNQKLESNDFTGALADYDAALKISQDYRLHYQKGIVFVKQNKFAESIAPLLDAVKADANCDFCVNTLAESYFQTGDYTNSIKYYETVAQIGSSDDIKAKAKNRIGDCYEALGDAALKADKAAEAVGFYDKAIAINNKSRTQYQKSAALIKDKKFEEAVVPLQESIKLDPSCDNCYNNLGRVQLQLKNFEEAVKNFEKVLEVADNADKKNKANEMLALAHTNIGNDFLKAKNNAKAIESYTKAVSYDNNDVAYLNLAKAYAETGQWDNVIDAANKATQFRKKISKGGPYYYLGLAYKNKNMVAQAKTNFTEAQKDSQYQAVAKFELDELNKKK